MTTKTVYFMERVTFLKAIMWTKMNREVERTKQAGETKTRQYAKIR